MLVVAEGRISGFFEEAYAEFRPGNPRSRYGDGDA
jgi:hypothetical protein